MEFNAQTALAARIAATLIGPSGNAGADNTKIASAVATAWRIIDAVVEEQQKRARTAR